VTALKTSTVARQRLISYHAGALKDEGSNGTETEGRVFSAFGVLEDFCGSDVSSCCCEKAVAEADSSARIGKGTAAVGSRYQRND
jgi:hypothetical protein